MPAENETLATGTSTAAGAATTADKLTELKALYMERQRIFASAQKIADRFQGVTPENADTHKMSVDRLQSLQDQFDQCQAAVIRANLAVPEKERVSVNSVQDSFDELIHTAQALYVKKARKKGKGDVESDDDKSEAAVAPSRSIRLPKLQLPHFSGSLESWSAFYNLYKTSIHESTSLSPVEKFSYLLSLLEREPLDLVKTLALTPENYEVAWTLLIERYKNERRHLSHHFSGLLNLPELKNDACVPNLLTKLQEHTHALDALSYKTGTYGPLLVTSLQSKFSSYFTRRFEDSRKDSTKYPTIEEIIEFLKAECARLDDRPAIGSQQRTSSDQVASSSRHPKVLHLEARSDSKANSKKSLRDQARSQSRFRNTSSPSIQCPVCKRDHNIMRCPEFQGKEVSQRCNLVSSLKLCSNCLARHPISECASKRLCLNCNRKHHTMLHSASGTPDILMSTLAPPNTLLETEPRNDYARVVLGTVQMRLESPKGTMVVRGLLDSAAESSLLTSDCAEQLNLVLNNSRQEISGVSQTSIPTRGTAAVTICGRENLHIAKNHPVIVVDEITNLLPSAHVSPAVRAQCHDLTLADPLFDVPGRIQFLIAADLYPRVVTSKSISLGPSMPLAQGTVLGYTLIGPTPNSDQSRKQSSKTLLCIQDAPLQNALQRFWSLEEPKPPSIKEEPEDPAELSFRTTHLRTPTGRFSVRLPFREPADKLGHSYGQALRRFESLERRFRSNPGLREEYVKFMKGFQEAGFMVRAPPDFMKNPHYFIPHQGIIKQSSTTTKFRVVFDGSAKTSTGSSLNDLLHVGPKLLNDIRTVLINFRRHAIVFACDIKQMYLQVELQEEDRPFHQIIWRDSEEEPVQVHRLTTVTFGISSSAFLAIRSLHQLAQENQNEFPRAAQTILKNIYVDDMMDGDDTREGALALKREVVSLLSIAKFELRKWISNDPALLEGVDPEHLKIPRLWDDQQTSSSSILGLQWLPASDTFTYKITPDERAPTKRHILSAIATLFDPCGWVAPVVFSAKAFMQRLWLSGAGWDNPISPELQEVWKDYTKDLPRLSETRIPRRLSGNPKNAQLHGFCDASELGYAAVLYLRSEDNEGSIESSLIIAKSKVAPLKKKSIPRLELCAAVLLTSLLEFTIPHLSEYYNLQTVRAWSDSTIVLSWIQTPSYRLKTFVANRISFIQEQLPTVEWSHVKSTDNPADCCSRGLSASQLIRNPLWWHGPQWLTQPIEQWPQNTFIPTNVIPELKPQILLTKGHSMPENEDIFHQLSSWSSLQRIIALLLRFKHNASKGQPTRSGPLKSEEYEEAERSMVRRIQKDAFAEEKLLLESKLTPTARVRKLHPFLDKHGLIRVGGRLAHAELSTQRQHPWLLPSKHHLVDILIRHYHETHLHPGPQLLQSLLHRKYWILAGRSRIRAVVHQCIKCFRCAPRNNMPLMGELPACRVQPSRPFTHTGMDYAGPFRVKIHTLRFARIVPAYLCIFICMSTKAVHIEVAQDLTSDAFIAALSRFTARRGHPAHLYSDCGTNFKGASNELKQLYKELITQLPEHPEIRQLAQERQIVFHFNPPAAPHQGGIWEAAVKSAKTHLQRTLQGQTVTLEEFNTLSTRVEAMLNSRPLTALSSDPSDLAPLTPAHFLIGDTLVAPIERDRSDLKLTPLKRWHRVQAMSQAIWRRWSLEYLHTLQVRNKWDKNTANLQTGALVFVHDPASPPLQWPMARVTAVHPGADGKVRVATVQTTKGELQRPVSRLYPLPLEASASTGN